MVTFFFAIEGGNDGDLVRPRRWSNREGFKYEPNALSIENDCWIYIYTYPQCEYK
jgi:hypothetical protein